MSAQREPELAATTGFMLLGMAKYREYKVGEAAKHFERALRIDPACVEAWWMLGQCHRDLGSPHASFCYAEAVRHEPSSLPGRTTRAYALLLTGDFGAGWPAYEASRWEGYYRHARWWDGERFDGHVLLTNEGGHGDGLMWARWVPWIRERVGALTFEVQPNLVRLMQPQFRGVRVRAKATEKPTCDRHAFLGSLPALVRLSDAGQIPGTSYLFSRHPSPELPAPPGHLKVGLVWAGSGTVRPERRTIGLGAFAPVLAVEGVGFFSLQVGSAAAEVSDATTRIHDLSASLTDWACTAAVLSRLDLLITCDSGIAHLAGALGRPVWICLPASADWRWMLERTDTPWYASARLFRQRHIDGWQALFGEVAAALAMLVEERGRLIA